MPTSIALKLAAIGRANDGPQQISERVGDRTREIACRWTMDEPDCRCGHDDRVSLAAFALRGALPGAERWVSFQSQAAFSAIRGPRSETVYLGLFVLSERGSFAINPIRLPRENWVMPPRKKIAETDAGEFESLSVLELNELINRATEARESKLAGERRQFIQETRARAEALGMSLDELLPREPARRPKKGTRAEPNPTAVKYASPNGQTWTGRGRMPNWLAAAEADGRKREEFLVDKR